MTTMKPALKTYAAPHARIADILLERAFLQLSTDNTADNKYNPENDLGGIE